MALLKPADQALLQEEFKNLTNPVRLIFFTQALGCDTCEITEQILKEIAPLSDKLELVTKNFAIDADAVEHYGIKRIPALAIVRIEVKAEEGGPQESVEHDYGLRFYGVPSGYEFMTLIGDILDVSRGESGLSEQSKMLLMRVKEPVHFQVFTTPT